MPNQRFAFDFDALDNNDKRYKGKGKRNEDYYSFGKKVLSPANGVVVEAIDGVKDNCPDSMNSYSALGNAIIIKHSKNEVSVLAHLKQGSLKVKSGDKVKMGQIIGLCGNSGNSSEPHLHYHLQDNEIIQEGKGVKCYFHNIVLINKSGKECKTEHSPVKGDIVSAKSAMR
ncbi:MAG: peptidoglycan DD-metalloendopeptidase family protein [bacterium]